MGDDVLRSAGAREAPSGSADWFWPLAGVVSVAIWSGLTATSFVFEHGEGHEERPLLVVFALLVAVSVVYVVAALRAFRRPPSLRFVLVSSIVFRVALVPSTPIQEDDIYRYMWDGKVVASGLDPYLYSPDEIRALPATLPATDPRRAYAELRDISVSQRTIVERINNGSYATIYPPLLEWLFAVPGRLLPPDWPVSWQVTAFKTLFVVFDVGALLLLVLLLQGAGLPAGLAVLHGWCPVVLKEVSNSGHLDTVPVFFVAAALVAGLNGRRAGAAALSGLALGGAIAAKFYGLLLVPLLLRRLGGRRAVLAAVTCVVVVVLQQLAFPEGRERRRQVLTEFALSWEQNDAVFIWMERGFAALTSAKLAGERFGVPWDVEASGLIARAVVVSVTATLVVILALRTTPATENVDFLRRCFAVIVTVLLLGPLGFPWYFLWSLFFLPFLRRRSWLLLPGLLMVYYLRFWYSYQYERIGFVDEESAMNFFDHVVVPAEFLLLFLALGLEISRGRIWRRQDAL